MDLTGSRNSWPARCATDAGITLIEVLAVVFILGVGLLAELTLFPVGALEMAQAIQDDRTGAVAAEATEFARAGAELIARTAKFVEDGIAEGAVDPDAAAALRSEYDALQQQAAALEVQLEALQTAFPPEEIQRYLGPLLGSLRAIEGRVEPIIRLLLLVERRERE
jgi:hypothetical protein